MIKKEKNDAVSSFCKAVAYCDDQIAITTMIDESEAIGSYAKAGTLIPNLSMKTIKIIQVSLLTSIAKENENYLGRVNYMRINQELAEIILFPYSSKGVFCTVVNRPYDFEQLVAKISQALLSFNFTRSIRR